jgi:nitrogen fixation protein NifQ
MHRDHFVEPRNSRAPLPDIRASLHQHLMTHALGYANDALIGHLLAGWALGQGSLPGHLGLGAEWFERLMQRHFPRLRWQPPEGPAVSAERRERALEHDDLVQLLTRYADREVEGAFALARVVAEGCLGADHLWQDLGLPSRRELSFLMTRNFPRLAAENKRDMRWKKFLYRRLCEQEGLVACRSPSCEACCDYAECFVAGELVTLAG